MTKINLKTLIFYLFLSAVCLISIIGAAVYYFYQLNWLGISLTLVLSAAAFWLFFHLFTRPNKAHLDTDDIAENFITSHKKTNWKKTAIAVTWLAPYVVFFVLCSLFLFAARTDAALTSPWQVVSTKFFITYLLATAYLFWLILKKTKPAIYLIAAHYFLSFSVLWIVFKIGYGYDPFIHQATVKLIDANGFVLPKTPYYLGQYSLILIAHKLFFIPIVWADKLLLPLLAALTIPAAIDLFLKKFYKNSAFIINHLSLIILLILPFSIFTLTVPQNLAYLFLLLAIFFSLFARTSAEIILSFMLALAALAAQPIAGIPAVLFALAMLINRQSGNLFCWPAKKNTDEICLDEPRARVLRIKTVNLDQKKKFTFSFVRRGFAQRSEEGSVFWPLISVKNFFYFLIYLLTAAILPLLFYFTGGNSPAGSSSSSAGFTMPLIIFPREQNIWLNFIYLILGNEWLILILLAILSAYLIHRWRHKFPQFIILGSTAASLLIAYFITQQFNFGNLISYERGDYAQRILIVAFIFIIPILAVLARKIIALILSNQAIIKYSWLAFFVILIAVSFYGAYPRLDNYYNSRSFSTGADDLAAVNWIAQDSSSTPYVVLADQQVSVGALWTFGFSHYFKNDIYFYPIPTGGPLYQIYLAMVYEKPDRVTALQASDLTGAHVVYFVINKYWTSFDKIVEQAKIDADSFQSINNGNIFIFKYLKTLNKGG
jgi:hypothetical protein